MVGAATAAIENLGIVRHSVNIPVIDVVTMISMTSLSYTPYTERLPSMFHAPSTKNKKPPSEESGWFMLASPARWLIF